MQPSHVVRGERKEKGAWLSLLQTASGAAGEDGQERSKGQEGRAAGARQ